MAKAKFDVKADWTQIDVDSLEQQHQDNWASMKAAYSLYKDAKAAFEAGMRTGSGLDGSGSKLVFGYNFGKLSLAVVPDEGKPQAKGKAVVGLADFLKAQAASGANT